MTKLFVAPAASVALAIASIAQGQVPSNAPGQRAPSVEVRSARPGVGSAKRSGTLTARVNAVDVDRRLLSLEDARGHVQIMKVGESVQRLNEIAPGDTITAKYEQQLTLEHLPEGAAPIERSAKATATRAGAESLPSGTQENQVRVTVTVAKADPLFRVVTLRDEKGESYQVSVGPDIDLAKIKTGQRYLATYTETLAVKLEKSGDAMSAPSRAK